MPVKSQKTAARALHFVAGSDDAGVKREARALVDRLAPGADAFGLEVIDGAVESVEAAVRAVESATGAALTMPFLGGKKVVWLKSASFLSDTVTGRSESVVAAVERLLAAMEEGFPGGVTFVLSAVSPDKRRSAYKKFLKLCETKIVDMPDLGFRGGEERLVEWTAGDALKAGLQLKPNAVEALAARVGLDPGQLANELEKLRTAFGTGHPVSAAEVRALVPQTREGGIFDLSEAILKRDLPLALDTLAMLFRQGEKGVGIILSAIVPTVRNLLLMKDLSSRHRLSAGGYANQFASALARLPESETAHLPRKKDGSLNAYPLSLALSHASNYSLDELRDGFCACAAAAQALFTSALGDDVVLARLLLGLLGRRTARAA